MEYIKKEELIEGEIYTHLNGNIVKYQYLDNTNKVCGSHIGENKNRFVSDLSIHTGSFNITELKLATSEEKHWLNTCIKLDKFITFEEAMKTFIPEYVECIKEERYNFYGKLGTIYKVDNWNYTTNDCWLKGTTSGSTCRNRFKPSTKEAYDAQFVVKEPEFVLPEKWCIKDIPEVKDFFQKYNNGTYTCQNNAYLHYPRIGCVCYFTNIQNDYTEITFEQFKKYVLKEEIDKEIIEPLPQFKVIETIETITKVENNEGNQFFIGDKVKTLADNIYIIKGFKYNVDKSNILAITDRNTVISIDKIEHYIEPKVEIEETLLDKAKRLYPIGTKVSNYNLGKGCTFIINSETFYKNFDKDILVKCPGIRSYTVYCDNEWAEIIK